MFFYILYVFLFLVKTSSLKNGEYEELDKYRMLMNPYNLWPIIH